MKSTVWKSTFREIKQSLGRYLAIMAIVALGVGLFAGLKVTQPAMLAMTEQYFEETVFYDYRLLSTVGFSSDDVELFREQEDVKAAEGAVSFDVICQGSDGNSQVIKAHSITEEVNQITLIAGEMPQEPNQCVVDASLYDESQIGEKIKLSEENDEDDLEYFAYGEYEITGIVQSPLYIQYERGSTSLGNGQISGFIYLLPEGFDVDYYTEIYVAFSQGFSLYDDAYDDYIDSKTDTWETLALEAAEERYEEVRTEAREQLADGKKELEEQSTKAKAELAEAKETLDDAAAQIADGEEQLAEAEDALAAAPAEIEANEAELAEAEQTIAEMESELDAAEIALGVGIAEGLSQVSGSMSLSGSLTGSDSSGSSSLQDVSGSLQEASDQISAAKAQIAEGREQIAAAKQELANGKAAIEAARQELADGEKELAEKKQELADAKEEYESGLREYEEALEEYNTGIAEAEQKIADGEKALAELEEPEVYVLGRDTNIGYVCFESDSGIVDGIANVFPVFFFLVAALVCMTTMNRMVEEQRTQIGTYKALGYGEWRIMSKYVFYSGSAAVLGCLLGFIGGTVLFPQVIWYAYQMMYCIGAMGYVFDWKLAVISLVVSLACSVGTTWVSCRYELAEVAAELMRAKAPKAGKRVFLEYLPFIWKRLKFLQKVSARNIFRYKKRFLMMLIGIGGCTALLVTGFGVRDSVTDVAEQQYTEIQIYDASVTYSEPIDAEAKEALEALIPDSMSGYCVVQETSVDLVTDGGTKSAYMVVADEDEDITEFLNLHTTKQQPIAYPGKNMAVLTHRIADDYGIEAGDIITLRDDDMNTIEVEVAAISQNFVYNYVYISAETYEEQMGETPEYKTAYVNAAGEQDIHLLSTILMNMDNVTAVSVNQDTMDRFASMMESMNLIVLVIILCAAGLAFIVLYNLTNINITERVREIATIKVLGFYENETSAYVFRENTVLTFLGALLGLVLGRLFHAFVMSQIKVDMIAFDVRVLPISYVYSVLLTLAFSWIVNQIMKKKIDQISMTESLKSVD